MKLSFCFVSLSLTLVVQSVSNPAITFSNAQRIFFSQASQDMFVFTLLYELTHKKDQGYYLEIGAAHPSYQNNSYFFEKNYSWKGISLEISSSYTNAWVKERKNQLFIEDATKADYVSILDPFPRIIDYLSLDIDNNYDVVLNRIPLNEYIFKVITIEHDSYKFGNIYKEKERAILTAYGYYLLCPDVTHPLVGSFEDWWIHPSAFESEEFLKLTSVNLENKNHYEIIKILKSLNSHN